METNESKFKKFLNSGLVRLVHYILPKLKKYVVDRKKEYIGNSCLTVLAVLKFEEVKTMNQQEMLYELLREKIANLQHEVAVLKRENRKLKKTARALEKQTENRREEGGNDHEKENRS